MAHALSTEAPGKCTNSQIWVFRTLLAAIAAAPLILLPGVLFYFDVTPKAAVVLAGTALALVLARPVQRLGGSRSMRWLFALLCAQAASLALSTALSANVALSFTGGNWRRFGLVTQLALLAFTWLLASSLAVDPSGRVRWLLRTVAACGSFAALYGIAQYSGWDPLLPAASYHVGEGVWAIVRPPGTLGHAAYFATYLLHAVFAGAALMMSERRRAWKFAGLAACTLGSAAIVLSGTRAAVAGLAAGGVVLFCWFRPRVSRRGIAAAIAACAVLLLFYASPAGQKLRARVRWSAEDALGGARLLLWRDSLRMAAGQWQAGTGPEMFASRFPLFQSSELAAAYPDFYHESPHNIFLDALAAQGVGGVLILLATAGLGFGAAWRARAGEPRLSGALAATLAASLAGQQFSVFTIATALLFYATVAALVALATPSSGAVAPAAPAPLLWGAQFVAAAGLAVFTVHLVAADHALAAARESLARGDLAGAVTEHARALRWQPPGMNAELWYSRSLVAFAQKSSDLPARLAAWEQAFQAAQRATASPEERQNAFYNLAALYAARNDASGAERSLRSAIACAPKWYKPHWMLAQVLRLKGRLTDARDEAEQAVQLNGGKHAEVSRTLADIKRELK